MEKEFYTFLQLNFSKLEGIGLRFLGAFLILFFGIWIARFLRRILKKGMQRRDIDPTVQIFANQLIKWILYIALFLAVVQQLGVPISSFLGALTASAVAVGLALQGSLSNFAGGIMLLILKPFRIGDTIKTKGEVGVVKSIGMFYTHLRKFGNEEALIPNGPLFADTIINFTKEEKRRIKIIVSIAYDADMKQAKNDLFSITEKTNLILKNPEPQIFIEELSDDFIQLCLCVWVNREEFNRLRSFVLEEIKSTFDELKITHSIKIS